MRDNESVALQRATLTEPRVCGLCGERYWSAGAHMERCMGPRAHGACDCPPGWKHESTCVEVVGETDA